MSVVDSELLSDQVHQIALQGRQAALQLGAVTEEKKNQFLALLADTLLAHAEEIMQENAKDLQAAQDNGLSAAMVDRLALTQERIAKMADGVRQVAALPDPVGELLETVAHPNGMSIEKRRVPLGVIGIIYESRPNVTVDCAVLCLKSGNASILRGGKEAFYSNSVLSKWIQVALVEAGLPEAAVQLIPTTDREALNHLLKEDENIHCIIPRGGESLIRFVAENSRIPVIKHYLGVCNAYVDAAAQAARATEIVVNAKCQRPGVCNAIENLFVHEAAAEMVLPVVAKALRDAGVSLRADEPALALLQAAGIDATAATEEDFYEEFLDKVLSVRVVASMAEAVAAIHEYGSGHSEVIITEDAEQAELFLQQVDSATVYWNASTRFTDGFEFGMGAEIGISTDKIHARGPMGLRELTSYKFVIRGEGQVRQ